MAKWDDVANSEQWMALNTDERKAVRQAYFDRNIRPSIPRGQEQNVWTAFERRTANNITPQDRSPLYVANDAMIEVANAAAGSAKAATDFFSPGNRVGQWLDENIIKPGEASQSDTVRTDRARFRRALSESDGIGDELSAVKDYVTSSPLMAASQAAGTFALPVGSIRAARAGAGALGLGARGVTIAGTGAGVGSGATLSGGDAAGGAYDAVMEIPDKVLFNNEAARELLGQGMTREQVRQRLAEEAGKDARLIPALLGGVAGAFGAERILAGRGALQSGLRGRLAVGASEALQEGIEEGITQYEGQRAAQQYDPSIDPTKNVAAMGAMGALQGGALGTVVGGGGHAQNKPGDSIADRYGDVARQREQEEGEQTQEVLALPAPEPIVVDGQGNAVTAAQRNAREQQAQELGLTPDVENAARQYQQYRDSQTEPSPALALPAPAITVDSEGIARTPEQRNAEAQESLARAEERENLGITPDVENAARLYQQSRQPASEIDVQANEANTTPTDAQKAAGNYRMGHFRINGMDISVENPAGSQRSGIPPDGGRWSNTMPAHYGYIRGTRGADGDHVDVFIKPGTQHNYDGQVYVVSQKDPATGKFDEVKVMLGYDTQQQAEQAYRASYDEGWGGLIGVTPMDSESFRGWLRQGRYKQPRTLPLGTDILSRTGKPFLTRSGAEREAQRHPNSEVVMLGPGKFVVRPSQAAGSAPVTVPDTGSSTTQNELSMQNRDRSRPASIEQMNRIAADPDYDRLGIGRSPNEAAPLVSVAGDASVIPEFDMGHSDRVTLGDGSKMPFRYAVVNAGDVISSHNVDGRVNSAYYDSPSSGQIRALNNGRIAGLQGAYQRGTASKYQLAMINDANGHGISAQSIMAKDQPILVRVYNDAENQRPNIGALSNPQSNLGMSASEQAANDARIIDMNHLDDTGNIETNRSFLDAFAARLQQQGEDFSRIKDAQGRYSRQFIDRAKSAIFYKAYGDETLTAMVSENAGPELKNILNAMSMAASEFAQVEAGPLDMRPQLVQAVHQIREARARGLKLDQFISQQDMFGRDALADKLTQLLWENTRSPKRLAQGLRETAKFIHNEQNRSANVDMFGGVDITADDIVSKIEHTIKEQNGQESTAQTSLNLEPTTSDKSTVGSDGERRQQNTQQRSKHETSRRQEAIKKRSTKQPRPQAGVFTSGKHSPAESRQSGKGISSQIANQSAKAFMQKLPGASRLKVTVVRSPSEIKTAYRPSHIAEGVYYPNGDSGHIYLVANNLDTVNRLEQVLAHEVIGHYGVEAFLGDKFDDVVNDVQRIAHAPQGAKITGKEKPGDKYYATLESVQRLYGDISEYDQAREVLARMAETRSKPTFLATVYAKIRAALRSLGFDIKLTTADLRQMVADAGRFLQHSRNDQPVLRTAAESKSGSINADPQAKPQRKAAAKAKQDVARPGENLSNAERRMRERALGKIGAFAGKDTIQERIAKAKERWREKAVQGIFDQFAPLKNLSPTAFMQARLSKGSAGAVEYMIRHGAVKLTDGAIDTAGGKGFAQILADLKGEHDHFLAWIAGNRASRLASEWEIVYDNGETQRFPDQFAAREAAKDMVGVKLQPASRENLFTADDINTLKKLNLGRMADGRNRKDVYDKALRELNTLQHSVLDVAQEAGLIDKDSRALWETEFYVPFYRVMEEDNTGAMGPGQIGGLVGQRAFKKLSGGTEKLGDLAGNTISNWDHLLGASMKNMAAQNAMKEAVRIGIAKKIGSAAKGSVRIMENGKEVHYMVEDPLVLDALTSLNFVGYKDPFMKVMRSFKHALTMGVTISPTFRIRNMLRDTLQAISIDSNIKLNPVANIINGWNSTKEGSETMSKLLAGGGAIRFGSFTDGQGIGVKRMAEELNIDSSQVITSPAKLASLIRKTYDLYQETGDRAETINRAAIYDAAREKGKSHLEASYAARDLMDFTAGGQFAAIRILSQILPFFNARLQGMYKLGRGAQENPRRFWAVSGALGLASALLYLTMKDDDDYKALPDWARNSYWVAKLPGTNKMIYIPKPFEVGALGSIVERGTELAFSGGDYKLADFGKTVAGIIGDQLAMNPIPQAVKPALEVAFNYDSFKEQPIDSVSQQRLLPQDRYTSSTSAGAIALGNTLGVSPRKIEHLARGYFGWLGTQALNVSDYLARPLTNLPDNPRRDLSRIDNWFVVGDFIKEADPVSSKYIQRFYDEQREINQVYAAFNQARNSGNVERAQELLATGKLDYHQFYAGISKQLSEISQRIKALENSDLPAPEKRSQLNELYRIRNQLTMMADERIRERQSRN